MNKILQCCHNNSVFLVEYNIGSKFFVCDSCMKLKQWARGIKEKTPITDIKDKLHEGVVSGSLTPTSQQEVTGNAT